MGKFTVPSSPFTTGPTSVHMGATSRSRFNIHPPIYAIYFRENLFLKSREGGGILITVVSSSSIWWMAEEYWGWILDVFYFSNEKYFIFWKNIVRDGSSNGGLFHSFFIFEYLMDWGMDSRRVFLFSNICAREIFYFFGKTSLGMGLGTEDYFARFIFECLMDGKSGMDSLDTFYFRTFVYEKYGDGSSTSWDELNVSNICVREIFYFC